MGKRKVSLIEESGRDRDLGDTCRSTKKKRERVVYPRDAISKSSYSDRAIEHKIFSMVNFLDQKLETALESNTDRDNYVVVTETALMACITTLSADFELKHPGTSRIEDVQEAIVKKFVRKIGSSKVPTGHILIDLAKHTAFETSIHDKISDCVLAKFNLLEVELEMYTHRVTEAAAQNLIRAVTSFSLAGPDIHDAVVKDDV